MTDITEHLSAVRAQVRRAAERTGRHADDVTIVAVSKQQSIASIQEAFRAGQRHFGESYAQEAEKKIAALEHLDIVWHFIGRIQANKTRFIAEHFDWVHTVDRERIAKRLDAQRPYHAGPLNVLIQVSLCGEAQKGGVREEQTAQLAAVVGELPRLRLRGLMTIAPADMSAAASVGVFERLVALRDRLASAGPPLDTLSMGMSGDFEAAIAAGATCVRIGTAIFGARPAPDDAIEE